MNSPIRRRKPGPKAYFDDPDRKSELLRMLDDERLTHKDIAKHFGKSESLIERTKARLRRQA